MYKFFTGYVYSKKHMNESRCRNYIRVIYAIYVFLMTSDLVLLILVMDSFGVNSTSIYKYCEFGHMGTRLLRNDSHRSIRQNNRVVRLTKTVQSNFRATRNITTSFSIGLGARCEVRSIAPTEREKIKF